MTQKGFTLVEMLVALAVGSIILSSLLLSVFNIQVTNQRDNLRGIAVTEIHRAALQIKKDLQSHTTANVSDLQVAPTTLEWIDETGYTSANESHQSSSYSLSGKILSRNFQGVTTILGRNIESVIFSDNGTHINVAITANKSKRPEYSETLFFSVSRRSSERYD